MSFVGYGMDHLVKAKKGPLDVYSPAFIGCSKSSDVVRVENEEYGSVADCK